MTIAATISAQRKARSWTQERLAQELRVSVRTVANWEHGRTLPDIDNVVRLATLWQLPLEALLGSDLVAGIKHQQQDARWHRWLGLAPTANNTVLAVLLFTALDSQQISTAYIWLLDAAIGLNAVAMVYVMARTQLKKPWRQFDAIDWLDQALTASWVVAMLAMALH